MAYNSAYIDSAFYSWTYQGITIESDIFERIVQSFTLVLNDEVAGDNVDVDTILDGRQTGIITSLDIDLNTFTADCEVRG